jgi:UDP-2-acetamido-3-amino-2,3-dideoxy-glucuronate N-acetyltransferase
MTADILSGRAVAPGQTEAQTTGRITNLSLQVPGCQWWRFPQFSDARGQMTVAELDGLLPFAVRRLFFTYGVPSGHVRAEHALRTCTQVLLALGGAVTVTIDDGLAREEVRLDDPSLGLLIPPRVWRTLHGFENATMLAVFCSEKYDAQAYIRDYDEFLASMGRVRRD